jgi:hypothetical protein
MHFLPLVKAYQLMAFQKIASQKKAERIAMYIPALRSAFSLSHPLTQSLSVIKVST